jgi:hypothetical protein
MSQPRRPGAGVTNGSNDSGVQRGQVEGDVRRSRRIARTSACPRSGAGFGMTWPGVPLSRLAVVISTQLPFCMLRLLLRQVA